jgi:hypothetical protein
MEEHRNDNIVVKQWHQLAINNLLVGCLSKFLKLVSMTIVQVIGNVKYEKTFSTFDLHEVQASKLIGLAFGHCYMHVHSRHFPFPSWYYKLK